jgi:WD40 repeat protein
MNKIILLLGFLLLSQLTIGQDMVLTAPFGHSNNIKAVKYSPDSKYIVTGSADKNLVLWDASTGNQLWKYSFGNQIYGIDISPDSKTIAVAGIGQEMALVDLATGKEISRLKLRDWGSFSSVTFSKDGARLLTASEKVAYIWSIKEGKIIKTFKGHLESVNDAFFSPDEKTVYTCSDDKTIKAWNAETGLVVRTFTGHTNRVDAICVSPDGKYLVSGSVDNSAKIWNATSGVLVKTIPYYNAVSSVRFSPDGKVLAIGLFSTSTSINLLKTGTWAELGSMTHQMPVNSLCFSPDSKNLVTVGQSEKVRLWNTADFSQIREMGGQLSGISTITLTPDGKQLYLGNYNGQVNRFSLYAGKMENIARPTQGIVGDLNLSANGEKLFYHIGYNIVEYNTVSKQLTRSTPCSLFADNVDVTPDGKYGLSNESFKDVALFNLETGTVIKRINIPYGRIEDAVFCNDGQSFIIFDRSDKKEFIQFDLNGNEIKRFPVEKSTAFCPAENGRSVFYYNPFSPIQIEAYMYSDNSAASISPKVVDENLLKISKNGSLLVFNSGIYNLNTCKLSKFPQSHTDEVKEVDISPDGRFTYTCAMDGTIKIWSNATAQLLLTIYPVGKEDWVASAPDGRFDGSPEGLKKLYYVKGLEVLPLESLFEQFFTPNLISRTLDQEKMPEIPVSIATLQKPAVVEITNPVNGTTQTTNTLTIELKATDQGGGVDEIVLYQNGKLIETTTRGFKEISQTGGVQTKTFSVTLSPGENRFRAVAYNSQRTESNPVEIVVNYKVELSKPDLYLFVVGINKYKNPKYTLNFAGADALAFKEQIEQGGAGIYGSVNVTYITDDQATKAGIMARVDEVKARARKEDVFVFYYAGHGVMSEETKARYYLALHDVTQLYGNNQMLMDKGISSEELQNISMQIPAQKQLFVIDACQSGGMTEMLASRGAAEEKAIAQLARSTGTFWLAASGTQQFATEFKELGHGVFTYCILQALQGHADSGNADRKITVNEISSFLGDKVPEISEKYKGEAQYPNSYGFGNDFPVVICK